MSYPRWRRQLSQLAGPELTSFIPVWLKIEPDELGDFFVELEFYHWWLAVKEYAARGEYHPSFFNHPKQATVKADRTIESVDLTGTGLPRKFARFYTKGLSYPRVLPRHFAWPATLHWPTVAITLGDEQVRIANSQDWHTDAYNPESRLEQMIADDPQEFVDSLQFWQKYYQTYQKLTPIERRFLANIPGHYQRFFHGHFWRGPTTHHWNPQWYLPGVDPKNYRRHLKKLESLGLIQIHRQGNGNITHFSWEVAITGPVICICQRLL